MKPIEFADIQITSAADALIAPNGQVIPFNQRAALTQRLFRMTPVEFQNRYGVPSDNALINYGYIYANAGYIQVGVEERGITSEQMERIGNYLKTLRTDEPVEVVALTHDPNTYKLMTEELFYQGNIQGLVEKIGGSPSQTGGGQPFQTPSNYTYVPAKGGVKPEQANPNAWKQTFTFPSTTLKPKPRSSLNIRFSDIPEVESDSDTDTDTDTE